MNSKRSKWVLLRNVYNFTKMDTIKKAMVEALKSSFGIVSTAASNVGISRQTHYNWIKDDPEYSEQVDEINEASIDFAESKLREKINGVTIGKIQDGELVTYEQPPSDTAIIFYLKTKGKKRGYVERQEISPVDDQGNSLQPIININVIRTKKEIDDSL